MNTSPPQNVHQACVLDVPYATDSSRSTPDDFLILTKPGVLLLVIYTAIVGLILAPGSMHPFLSLIVIFAIALGSAGAAAFNMWYDRDIDIVMERTKNRPIPQKRIAPADALTFAWLLSCTSVLILHIATNIYAAGLLAFSIFFYAVVYTMWLKRHTPQNIVIGGAAGAFPPVIGWTAVTGTMTDILPWLLFAIIFIWTPSHFWALAVHKSNDYKSAKIPMMPTIKGIEYTKTQIVIYSLILVALTLAIPHVLSLGWIYLVVSTGLGIIYLHLSLRLKRSSNTKEGMKLFGFSILYLFLIFTILIVDNYVHSY